MSRLTGPRRGPAGLLSLGPVRSTECPRDRLDGVSSQPGNPSKNQKNPHSGQLPDEHQERHDQRSTIGQDKTQRVRVKGH